MPTPVSTLTEFVRSRVESLGLSPHPEGGFYREVYRSDAVLPLPRGKRTLLTVIHFVLPPGGFSAWHVVRSDEVWTWAAGDVVWLHRLDDTGKHSVVEHVDHLIVARPVLVVHHDKGVATVRRPAHRTRGAALLPLGNAPLAEGVAAG